MLGILLYFFFLMSLKDPSHTVYAGIRVAGSYVRVQAECSDVVLPAPKKRRIKAVAKRSPKVVNDVLQATTSTQAPCPPAPARSTRTKTYY